MSNFYTDDEIMMCKHVTIIDNPDVGMIYTCELCQLPCEAVMRYSDGCRYEKVNPRQDDDFYFETGKERPDE